MKKLLAALFALTLLVAPVLADDGHIESPGFDGHIESPGFTPVVIMVNGVAIVIP